jgi:hypothetical protein
MPNMRTFPAGVCRRPGPMLSPSIPDLSMYLYTARRTLLLLCLLTVAGAAPARAQDALPADARLRLWLVPDRQVAPGTRPELQGRLVAATADTLVVRLHGQLAPVSVPVAWVDVLHVSDGPATRLQGALTRGRAGLLLGAGLGAAIGSEVARETDGDVVQTILVRTAAYAFSLGATTAILGAINPGERWRRVRLRGETGAGR